MEDIKHSMLRTHFKSMVQDGMYEIRILIENACENVKMSPSRLHKFIETVKQLKSSTSLGLILVMPSR